MTSPLRSLIACGTKLWLDSIDPDLVKKNRALGATGAIRTATLVHGMRRTGGKYGMVTMCIGTGMGAAGLFEIIH